MSKEFNPDKFLAEFEPPTKKRKAVSVQPQSKIEDFDPDEFLSQETEQGIGQQALGAVAEVGRFIDSYTGAPVRKGIGVLQEDFTAIPEAIKQGAMQFGAAPELAPTGQEIVEKAGIPRTALSEVAPALFSETGEGLKLKKGGLLDPTASGVAGLGLDVAADLTNVIPGVAIAKGVGRGIKAGAKGALELTGKALSKVLPETVVGISKAGIEASKDIANATSNFINPKLSKDFRKLNEIALKNNIDSAILPSSVKYGPQSSITRIEQTLAQRPGGEAVFETYQRAQKATQDAFDAKLKKIGDNVAPLAPADAGDVLREGFNDSQKKFFEQIDTSYDTISKAAPGMPLPKEAVSKIETNLKPIIENAERISKNKALSPGSRKQAEQVLES